MKNERGLELVTNRSSDYRTNIGKIPLLVIITSYLEPPFFKGGGGRIDLTKNPKKGGDRKIAKRVGGFCRKGRILLAWVFFLAAMWQM